MQPNWSRLKIDHQLKQKLLTREQTIDALRVFFKTRGFLEVETPSLVKSPGTEPYLEVFETTLKFAEGDTHQAFLLTSPEYAMKKLLAGGMGDIFQICKSFRNTEGRSTRHNSEFTILEYYRVNADYTALMSDLEELLPFLFQTVRSKTGYTMQYLTKELDLTPPYPKISVSEAFGQFVGLTADQLLDKDILVSTAGRKGYQTTSDTTWEEAYNQLFLNEIEPKLDQTRPTFIYDYPIQQAALSRKKTSDPRFAERFELYLAGIEIGNAFSELIDADEQEARLTAELTERDKLGKTKYQLDTQFIEALRSGLPECAGIAIGVDRLIMLLANTDSIQDVLFFPIEEMFKQAVACE